MLWTPGNEFQGSIDNFGTTWTDTGFGTSHTTGAANTKGTATTLIAGSSVTEDVYGILICSPGLSASVGIRNYLADLLIDPAGGTSWSTLIANLFFSSPTLSFGGYWYYFPLYLKNGTSIGVQAQCATTTIAFRLGVKLMTKPSHPHLLRVGSKVQSYGPVTSTTLGTTITVAAAGVIGTYTASLGVSSYDQWWWEAAFGLADSTMNPEAYYVDVAANATNKVLCAEHIHHAGNAGEQMYKAPVSGGQRMRNIASGQDIYARVTAPLGTANAGPTVCVYGVGG